MAGTSRSWGIVGAVLVTAWAWSLLRDSGSVLLDAEMNAPVVQEVREVIEQGKVPARITDLHVWRVGRGKYACVVGVVTSANVDADYFRKALGVHEELAHITVEVCQIPSPDDPLNSSARPRDAVRHVQRVTSEGETKLPGLRPETSE